jgi:hypothetical protein
MKEVEKFNPAQEKTLLNFVDSDCNPPLSSHNCLQLTHFSVRDPMIKQSFSSFFLLPIRDSNFYVVIYRISSLSIWPADVPALIFDWNLNGRRCHLLL